MRRYFLLMGALAALSLVTFITASPSFASVSRHLYVSPGASNAADSSCTSAGYGTIQAAVNAARPGSKVVVCAGTYNEQVAISTNLTLTASGTAVIQPTSPSVNATDEDSAQPIVAIVDVESGADVNLNGLTIDGSQIEGAVNGCSDDLVGVLYQAAAGGTVRGKIKSSNVENITPTTNCGQGLGIFVQGGPSGTAQAAITIVSSTVTGYGKNGITCVDVGTECTVSRNTITTSPTGADAQNGIQVAFGAFGSISHNTIGGNDWTYATDPNPQVQSDFAAGILLYAAGINTANVPTNSTTVSHNSLANNQIGVEVVDSAATVKGNTIAENSPGIADSVGVYGVACDAYCSYFNDDQGGTLSATAQTGQLVTVSHNTINFSDGCVPGPNQPIRCIFAAPPDSVGVWLGDNSWTGGSGYSGPAGSETVSVAHNHIQYVETNIVIGGGATT